MLVLQGQELCSARDDEHLSSTLAAEGGVLHILNSTEEQYQ